MISSCRPNEVCSQDVLKSFVSNDFVERECLNLCPLECNRTFFDTQTSSCKYLGDSFFDRIKSNPRLREDFLDANVSAISTQKLRESVVRVFVFYDSLSYVESSDETNAGTILELVSSIGGILNLFMGISVLNVFSLLEVLMDIILILTKKS